MKPSSAFLRGPIVRVLAALVPLWFTTAVLVFGAPAPMKLAVAAMLALSISSTYYGLLAMAAFVPLADYIGILLELGSFRLGEAVTVAFITGWLLRRDSSRSGPRVSAWLALALTAIVTASMVVNVMRSDEPASTLRWAFYGYYLTTDGSGWADGARILEGIAIVAAVFTTLRQRPQAAVAIPAALAASLAAAGLTSVLLWFHAAPATILQRHALIGYRYTAHVADVNAAGSYFVLGACMTLGMAVWSSGRQRLFWIAAAALGIAGAWLAGSRAANAAAFAAVAGAAAWWLVADWSRAAKVVVAAAAAVVVIGAGVYQIRELMRDPDYRSADFRQQFNAASLRMIAAAPLSGVGIGEYRLASPLFLGPPVAYSYGAENAHNYFLQLAAELGLIGFLVFGAWLVAGIARALRAVAIVPRDARLLGLLAGTIACIATWATGHPLLLTEVAVPFWIAFGLMWALGDASFVDANPAGRRPSASIVAMIAAAVVIAAQLTAADPLLRPPDSRDITGIYEWETAADGTRFRWTGEYGSVFVPSDVTRVYIPVRVPAVAPAISPMQVEARTAGRPGTRMMVGDGWAIFNLPLPDAAPGARFKRINLHADHAWQPALFTAGSSDMREVGVQIGETKLFRER